MLYLLCEYRCAIGSWSGRSGINSDGGSCGTGSNSIFVIGVIKAKNIFVILLGSK